MYDSKEITPLIKAAQHGHLEIVKYLFGEGANIEDSDLYSNTALYFAAKKGHFEIASFLVASGAKISSFCFTEACGSSLEVKLLCLFFFNK